MSSDREHQELVQAFRSVDSQIEEAKKLLENTFARIRNLKQQRKLLAERGLSGHRSEHRQFNDLLPGFISHYRRFRFLGSGSRL
jgi:hypothetical protein